MNPQKPDTSRIMFDDSDFTRFLESIHQLYLTKNYMWYRLAIQSFMMSTTGQDWGLPEIQALISCRHELTPQSTGFHRTSWYSGGPGPDDYDGFYCQFTKEQIAVMIYFIKNRMCLKKLDKPRYKFVKKIFRKILENGGCSKKFAKQAFNFEKAEVFKVPEITLTDLY